jgi:cell division transport system permease protein
MTTRSSRAARKRARMFNRIMPDRGISGRMLTASMSIMCYLACLALGALIFVTKSIDVWSSDISGEVTVQIRPVADVNMAETLKIARKLLEETDGVSAVNVLDADDAAELLEPWLGSGKILEELPIPRLIAVEIDPKTPPDMSVLATKVETSIPGGTLDTHRQWQSQITRTAGTLRLAGYGILLLVALAAVALVVFATRAAMDANRDTIQVLHLAGARDEFIASEVQRQFLKLGLRGGLIGMLAGIATFVTISIAGHSDATTGLVQAGRQLLFGPQALSYANYLLFLLVPLTATLISVMTARLSVVSMLRRVL